MRKPSRESYSSSHRAAEGKISATAFGSVGFRVLTEVL